jgi:hypothetical protein
MATLTVARFSVSLSVIRQHIDNLGGNDIRMNGDDRTNYGSMFNNQKGSEGQNLRRGRNEEVIEDLEDSLPGVIPTISNQVSNHVALVNGNTAAKHTQQRAPGANGHVPNGRPNFKTMLEDSEMDSHI